MAQGLGALAALAEAPVSVLSTYAVTHKDLLLQFQGSDVLFFLTEACAVYTHTCKQNTHIIK